VKPYYDDGAGIVIYHGDCREVLPTLGAGSIDLVLTDPPYGDDHDTDYTRFSGGTLRRDGSEVYRYRHAAIAGDSMPFDPAPLIGMAGRVVLFGANRFSDQLPVGSWFVWNKRTPSGSKGVMSDAEVAWYSHGRGVYIFDHVWDGFNRASERQQIYHPTQKPVALMRWCIEKTRITGTVLDPYMGSGPVALACRDLHRPYIGIEIEERYCEIAAKRLQQSVMNLTTKEIA